MFVLYIVFHSQKKKCRFSLPICVFPSRCFQDFTFRNTAKSLIHFRVHSFKKFIPCQSHNRCVVLGLFVRVLKDFLGTYMCFQICLFLQNICIYNTVKHCSKFLRVSGFFFPLASREKVCYWHGPGKTNEHLFHAEEWIPLCTAHLQRRNKGNPDSGQINRGPGHH